MDRARSSRPRLGFALPAAALALAVSCLLTRPADPGPRIHAALVDLQQAGFEFDADVRFRTDPFAACDGIACATLVILQERRTILLARDAASDEALLRASLLDIWERYQNPRPGSTRDLARGALRVVRDGPRVGVDDRALLRRAHHTYGQLYRSLAAEERADLPDPAALAFP